MPPRKGKKGDDIYRKITQIDFLKVNPKINYFLIV